MNNNTTIEIFYMLSEDAFVCGAYGSITIEMLTDIEKDFKDNYNDGLDQGDGTYTFKVVRDEGQFDGMGRCEIAPYWDLTLIKFEPIPKEYE